MGLDEQVRIGERAYRVGLKYIAFESFTIHDDEASPVAGERCKALGIAKTTDSARSYPYSGWEAEYFTQVGNLGRG